MTSQNRLLLVITIISFLLILISTLSTTPSQQNIFNRQSKASKMKISSDMRRIRQMLQPFHSLLNSWKFYREYHSLLKTLWACCPSQRNFLFDRRDVHESLLAMSDCRELIKHNQSQLPIQCLTNLKLFNPVTTDLPKCDEGLLRNTFSLCNYTTIQEVIALVVFILVLSSLIFLK
jgi:hypothetical protein